MAIKRQDCKAELKANNLSSSSTLSRVSLSFKIPYSKIKTEWEKEVVYNNGNNPSYKVLRKTVRRVGFFKNYKEKGNHRMNIRLNAHTCLV